MKTSSTRLVVSQVQELQRQGVPLKEMAVLVRAGYHSFDLEIELARAGITSSSSVASSSSKAPTSRTSSPLSAPWPTPGTPGLSWHRLLSAGAGRGPPACAKFDTKMGSDFTIAVALKWLRSQKRPRSSRPWPT